MPRGHTKSANLPRLLIVALALLPVLCAATLVNSELATAAPPQTEAPECATGVDFLGFSDAPNKPTFKGESVGGLSALLYDARSDVYYSLVDNGPSRRVRGTVPWHGFVARFYTLRRPTQGGETWRAADPGRNHA
jgi:3-phytase